MPDVTATICRESLETRIVHLKYAHLMSIYQSYEAAKIHIAKHLESSAQLNKADPHNVLFNHLGTQAEMQTVLSIHQENLMKLSHELSALPEHEIKLLSSPKRKLLKKVNVTISKEIEKLQPTQKVRNYGYQHGLEDGMANSRKKPRPAIFKAISSADYLLEYLETYRTGYREGLRKNRRKELMQAKPSRDLGRGR